MVYANDSAAALAAMEYDRLGGYDSGEAQPIVTHCPICGERVDFINEFYTVDDEIIGCNYCVKKINEYGGEI